MARINQSGTSKTERDDAITELYRLMIARDQTMWDQLTERDSQLQDRMLELCGRILDANSMDRVVMAGFTTIADQLNAQLEPLRELAPSRTQLDEEQDAALASLRRALTRQDFSVTRDDRLGPVISGNVTLYDRGSFV